MERTFLFATDGSETSRVAESYIEKWLHPESDHLVVVTVAEQIPAAALGELAAAGQDLTALRDELKQEAETIASEARERLKEQGFDVKTEVTSGRPGVEICRLADDRGVDAIVLGRRGRGTIGELLLGSVSHYVIHHATKPVTIIPAMTS